MSWIAVAFAAQQIIRLGTNVILALIVTPSVFGVMLILNTLRTGVEQLTDVGIGKNIVYDPMGNRPRFYNTAWTIQIVRGFLLCGIFLLASPLLASMYGEGELGPLLPIFAVIFILAGFTPPTHFLLQKNHKVSKLVLLDLMIALGAALLAIAFALISPTAESLVWAMIVNLILGSILAAALMNWRHLRLVVDIPIARRIMWFGTWVFLASFFHFAATNFDRLYLAALIPLSLLGVYGISRSFSDTAFFLANQVSAYIVFPKVAENNRAQAGLAIIAKPRAIGLLVAGALLGVGLAIADIVVDLLYDERYAAAEFIFPLLLLGSWFAILAIINEAIVYGVGKPKLNAGANIAKFAWLAITVPFAFTQYGLLAALVMIALADLPRYLVLSLSQPDSRGTFIAQDILATLVLVSSAAILRFIVVQIGWASDFIPAVPAQITSL